MMDFSHYRTIRAERRGRILTLVLDRPDKLNAVDEAMHGELSTIFDEAADDTGSDVIVLTGAGRAFSAGGDIAWMQKMIDEGFGQTAREARRIVMTRRDHGAFLRRHLRRRTRADRRSPCGGGPDGR
jgi:enoyl-CoA hydratase